MCIQHLTSLLPKKTSYIPIRKQQVAGGCIFFSFQYLIVVVKECEMKQKERESRDSFYENLHLSFLILGDHVTSESTLRAMPQLIRESDGLESNFIGCFDYLNITYFSPATAMFQVRSDVIVNINLPVVSIHEYHFSGTSHERYQELGKCCSTLQGANEEKKKKICHSDHQIGKHGKQVIYLESRSHESKIDGAH